MSISIALAVTLAISAQGGAAEAGVGDAPPVPADAPVAENPPAPVAPRAAEKPGQEAVKPEVGKATPKADAVEKADDEWSMVTTLGTTGCVVGGLIPGLGVATGLTLFYGGVASSACGPVGAALGIPGIVLATPALLSLAPCAAGGAACGAAVGAVMDDEDPATAAAWTIPGLVIGTLGGGLATVGLFVTNPAEPAAFAAGSTMIVVGSLLALVGGPLAVIGATMTRTPAVPEPGTKKPVPAGTAVDVLQLTNVTTTTTTTTATTPPTSTAAGLMQF